MKILFISYKYPPDIGGMQKQSFELITGMRERCEVVAILKKPQESVFSFFFNLKKRIKRVLRQHPTIDIIHFNDGVCAQFCTWLNSYTDIPLTLTYHGLDLVFPNKWYQNKGLKRVQQFGKVICVSDNTKKECLKRGFTEEQLTVIPNGVDPDIPFSLKEVDQSSAQEFSRLRESYDNIIVSIGRPVKRKGFVWFIQKVLNELPERTAFVLVSPHKPTGFFRNVIYELLPQSMQNQIDLFLGFPNDQSLLDAIDEYGNYPFHWFKNKDFQTLQYIVRNADLMVMPNVKVNGDAEGFGLVALEASIMSKVVMAAYVDGIPDAIHNELNGYLLPTSNESIWTEVIHSFFEMEEKDKIRLSETFKNYTIETFSWNKMVNSYYQVFADLLEKKQEDVALVSRAS